MSVNRRVWGLFSSLLLLIGTLSLLLYFDYQMVGTAVMSPTVDAGDTVSLRPSAVHRRDVVVVDGWNDFTYTLRVIGVGGDVIVCDKNGQLTINGQAAAEPFAEGRTDAFGSFQVTVPEGRIFVMGDQRSISADSRSHLDEAAGSLPLSAVRGRVVGVASPVWSARPISGLFDFVVYACSLLALLLGALGWLRIVWPEVARLARQLRGLSARNRRTSPSEVN